MGTLRGTFVHSLSVLWKFVGPVGQSDISYECPKKNVRVSDQMSDRKYINMVEEKKRNTSDHKGLQFSPAGNGKNLDELFKF